MDEKYKGWLRRVGAVATELSEAIKTAPDGGSVSSPPGLTDGLLAVAKSIQELAAAGHNLASAIRESGKERE